MTALTEVWTTERDIRRREGEINYAVSEKKCFSKRLFPRGYWKELKIIVSLAIPLLVTQISLFSNATIALAFCGRLTKIEFDGGIIAVTLISTLALAVAIGLCSACDTLFAQIYGSDSRHKLGLVLIRSLLLMTLSAFVPVAVFLNAENLLIYLGQELAVSKLAARYLLIFSPAVFAFFIHIPLSKYLQNQGILRPTVLIGILGNITNFLLHLILVANLGYGLDGSAVAQVICHVTCLSLTIGYITVYKVHKATWTGWSTECLLDWSQMFCLGWFGLVMTCVEWWSYEAGQILAGLLGTTEVAAQSVVLQISMYNFVIYLGFAFAVNIRVGHFLGDKDPEGAINSCRVVFTIIFFTSLLFSALICGLKNVIPKIFTDIPEVINMAISILPWYAICCLFKGTVVICNGILRAVGRQNIGSLVIIIAYIIGLAVGVPLMLKSRKVEGFWQGIALALLAEAVVFSVLCACTDWNNQAKQAVRRVSIATGSHDEAHHQVTSMVYLRTALVVFLMLSVLTAGILVKIYVPTFGEDVGAEHNSTQSYNNTY